MKVAVVMQARMGSSRLPGKILAPLLEQPILSVIVRRLARLAADAGWIATSREAPDAVTAAWGSALGWSVFRGDETDVLSRFTGIARACRPDWIVRLTADNPFVDAGIVACLVETARQASASVALIRSAGAAFPLGYVPEIVRAEALLEAEKQIPPDQGFHRSHVTSWVAEKVGMQPVACPSEWPRRPGWRWTVDTESDYRMATAAFGLWREEWRTIDYPEMAHRLDAHPEIVGINAHIGQKDLKES